MPVIYPWLTGSARSLKSLRAHINSMTHVSPTWLRVGVDGRLACEDIPEVSELARASGVKLVPLLANQGFSPESAAAALLDPVNRRTLAAEVADKVIEAGWDGICLDFEGPWAYRSEHTDFAASVCERLQPLGKEVGVAAVCQVGPPRGAGTDALWTDPFDYPALGQLVDRFILMGYDWHPVGGPPGPVGPIWWLRRVLEWTLTCMPASKVVLGLPLYGYHWVIPPVDKRGGDLAATGLKGRYVPFDEAEALRAGAKVPLSWDYDAWSRHFHYVDEQGRENVVHYDDALSLISRLSLVEEHNLAGAAFWSLGQEDPALWDALDAWSGRV